MKAIPRAAAKVVASVTQPLAKNSLRRQRASDPGKPKPLLVHSGLVTRIEPFHKIARELPPLFERHWRELACDKDSIPLAPNWDLFFTYQVTGVLHVHTVRRGDILVGYIFNIVSPHLHYVTTLMCALDMFWLDPIYRGKWVFIRRWFEANERYLASIKVKKIFATTKQHFEDGRVGLIFKRMGYSPVEINWSKTIG